MLISIITLGCKVNQCESTQIAQKLCEKGCKVVFGLHFADIYVINTCSVTSEADRKSRQYITKCKKLNHSCKIIVLGCSSQNNAEKFVDPNVVAIGGTANKLEFVLQSLPEISSIVSTDDTAVHNIIAANNTESGRTRKFIKIQDGCNRFCSYCIIPYLRGRSSSVPLQEILSECVNCESHEVVFTGIDISSYGKDIGLSLTDLVKATAEYPFRKRLGSLECEVIDDELLKAMKDGNFCPHFHLSLQCGDDIVLKSMNRHYTTAQFLEKVTLIRQYFNDAAITTDIIVGYPTETDDSFNKSCEFVRECAFSDIHIFPYSSRSNTVASKKYSRMDGNIVKKRCDSLSAIKHTLHNSFLNANIGKIENVYVEDSENGYNVGYTSNYIKVYSHYPCGECVKLKLSALFKDGIIASDL